MTAPRRVRAGVTLFLLAAAGVAAGWAVAAAASIVDVIQTHRSFSVSEAHIRRGDAVRFSNDDTFTHQVAIRSPRFSYESAEQPPGQSITVTFPASGVFDVQCDIHPRMHLAVTVD